MWTYHHQVDGIVYFTGLRDKIKKEIDIEKKEDYSSFVFFCISKKKKCTFNKSVVSSKEKHEIVKTLFKLMINVVESNSNHKCLHNFS